MHDLRYAFRMLVKSPGFTAAAVLSLALGIGANTAVFSVVNAFLLKSLPYPEPDRLVLVWGEIKTTGQHRLQVSATDIADYRARNHVFEDISTYSDYRPVLTGAGEPQRIDGAQVGDGFFTVIGAKPMLGRVFSEEEQVEGNDFVAVLSYGIWQKRFASNPNIVGQTITLSARPYTVIGVMPPEFQSLPRGLIAARAEFYRPVAEPPNEKERSSRHLRAIARLKPGVTLAQAQAEMEVIASQLQKDHPSDNANYGVRLVSLREDLVGPARPAVLMLFAAVALLLLIACANVGNLSLARSIVRHREVAIRAALGASRARLIRQFLTESVVLALAGGLLGVLGAIWCAGAIEAASSQVLPLLGPVAIDQRVLGFTFALAVLTGIIFGCAPAFRASRPDLYETLNDGGRAPGATTRSPLRSAFVVAEVALAMMLLVSAGLLIKSILRLREVNPGFNPEHVLSMNVSLPGARYPEGENFIAFYDRLIERLHSVPGIEAAGLTSVLPVSRDFDTRTIEVENQPRAPGDQPNVDNYFVTPDYLRALSIPLLRGRAFTPSDNTDAPPVVLVSESLARKFWPGEDALGRRVRYFNSDRERQRPWATIVGIVADVKQYGLDTAGQMALYLPVAQLPNASMTLVVRTRGEPSSMVGAVRSEIVALDPEQAVFNIATMDDVLADSIGLRRFSMMLLGAFAALALLLAAIGIYGVLAQAVAQRTHEIGIRMALGAQIRDILALILGHGMTLVSLGILAGMVGALGVTRLLSNLLFGVAASDPGTFIAIALLLAAVAFLACYLPARRAARLNPLTALARN